ncbi:MAG: hypothetical protein HZB67_00190 [Candidatus Aenigmarchaeota archaeon]|nr:hypothetical protein [Candidatus Aenigmarchaeota archaeon]
MNAIDRHYIEKTIFRNLNAGQLPKKWSEIPDYIQRGLLTQEELRRHFGTYCRKSLDYLRHFTDCSLTYWKAEIASIETVFQQLEEGETVRYKGVEF